MKKYLLLSILSLIPFTEAFAETQAYVNAHFIGKGADVNAHFIGEKGTIVFKSVKGRASEIGPGLPRVHLDSGRYRITVNNGKKLCLDLTNFPLEDGKTYTITSSQGKEGCGIE